MERSSEIILSSLDDVFADVGDAIVLATVGEDDAIPIALDEDEREDLMSSSLRDLWLYRGVQQDAFRPAAL
jgi:hypothetical protein